MDYCAFCGRIIDGTQDAFVEDGDDLKHIDCNDPRGYYFGDDGMPVA